MSLPGGGFTGSNIGKANVDTFIPEIWTGEVKRELDANFLMKMCARINPVQFAKKGDTVHIPEVYRLAVNDKVYNTPVTLQNQTHGEFTMTIDKYKEVSFMIEDVSTLFVPGQYNIRGEYTREAGYALARDIDNFLLGYRAVINNFANQVIYNTDDGLASGDYQALNEASILAAMQILDERNVPREGRKLIVSPGQYTDLLTIERFSSTDYVNSVVVPNAMLGQIYGMPVYMSTQVTTNSLDGYTNGNNGTVQPTPGVAGSPYLPTQNAAFASLPYVGDGTVTALTAPTGVTTAIIAHPNWLYASMVQEPKVETSREVLFQADAVVTTQLYGAKVFREDHCVVIHTAS